MPISEACALAMLAPLAAAMAVELTEAWASLTLLLSAKVEQESPVPGLVSDWVPEQVTRAFAAGAGLAIHNQMTTRVSLDRVSLWQRISRVQIVRTGC